jgi:hypothetical protein
MELTKLECDILEQMAWDAHNVDEIIGFIRASSSYLGDFEIYRLTHDLLATWIDRGWLTLGKPGPDKPRLASVNEVLTFLEQHGPEAVSLDSEVPLPDITLTDQAFLDVEWLRGAV